MSLEASKGYFRADPGVQYPKFNPDTVQIDRLDLSASTEIKQMGASQQLPYLYQFLKHIEHKQERADERFGRHYQRSILRRHALRLPSPRTGKPMMATESVAIRGKTFYRFLELNGDAPPIEYFVIASRITSGFPLVGLLLPEKNLLLTWERAGRQAVNNFHLAELARARSARNPTMGVSRAPVILMGHTNFAHHFFNEISALETIIQLDCLPPRSLILIAREPLGNIDDIFPELQGHRIRRVDPSQRLCGIKTGGLFVNLGALCIPERLRQRVIAFAQSRASAAARTIIADIVRTGGPVFWISVRTQIPTLTNQQDVLARIVNTILHTHNNCAVVLDGFSLPEDFARMPEEMRTAYARFGSDTREACDRIIASVRATSCPGPRQLVTTVAGMSLLDCFAVAQCASVYLCHAGSIQHKVGWTANVPGIIHGNRKLPVNEILARHSTRLENAVAPLLAPMELLADVASDDAQCNYTCVNPAEFSRFVLGYFRRCLSLTTSPVAHQVSGVPMTHH